MNFSMIQICRFLKSTKNDNVKSIFCLLLLALSLSCGESSQESMPLAWEVENDVWSEESEVQFSDFVAKIGEGRALGRCIKLGDCLRSPDVNPYYNESDLQFDLFADCADLPIILRAYFAFKKKLPFNWVAGIHGDRYSEGNRPKFYFDQQRVKDLSTLFKTIGNSFHTGMFRMAPEVEGGDTYPVVVSRTSIRPGTVFYDPNGHVLIVYKVSKDGEIFLLDGHPDNSLTYQKFGPKFVRGRASVGGGFRNFRPYYNTANGIVRTLNEDIGDFSATDQYASSYKVGQVAVSYHEWIKATLAGNSSVSFRPVEEIYSKTLEICDEVGDRVDSVNAALKENISLMPHPELLPENIFGAKGLWEAYSTPSRDARLKASYRESYRYVKKVIGLKRRGDPSVLFDGNLRALVNSMRNSIDSALSSDVCQHSYLNSDWMEVPIDVKSLERRIYHLSFDPYHCPELRWGAFIDSPEFMSCPDDMVKLQWYGLENRLRNIIDRDMTKPTPIDFGPIRGEKIGYIGLLDRLAADENNEDDDT